MKNEKVMKFVVAALMVFIGLVLFCIPIISNINFGWECEEYIKRAADAASPEKCSEELDKAIEYAKKHGMTTGNTGIIFKTPACDVGFWYDNLVNAREVLREVENTGVVKPSASALERSNVLIRVRETLIDSSNNGVSVTLPPNIGFYPYVLLFNVIACVGSIIMLSGCALALFTNLRP